MQTFYNQAILSHNNIIRTSNIVTGVITDVISVDKTATKTSYTHGDEITYIVSIVNSGATAINGLTINDDLGAYSYNGNNVVPLEYIENSVRYFVNGTLQAAPTVNTDNGLQIIGISIPAGGNAVIVYTVSVDPFAPLGIGTSITNTATVSGAGIINDVTANETVNASTEADLAIVKSLSPSTIYNNGQLTYTLTIQNYGASPVVATENAIVSDTFNPILNNLSVTFNGTAWNESENYSYNETTGVFETLPGNITVPAAVYTQDPESGLWTVTPGISVITVTGNI